MFKKQTACSCDGEKSSNNQQKSKTSCHNQNNGCNDEDKNGQEKHQKIKHMEISIHNCNSTNSNNTTSNNNCNINNNTGNNNNTTSSNNNNSSHNISSSTLENNSQPTPRRKSTVLSVLRKFSIHSHNMGNMENQDKSPRRKSSISLAIVRKFSNFSSSHRRNGIYVKGITIPSNCKFKFVVRTVRRELTVSFMLPGMPGYALTTNKTDEVYAEKVINDPKFWERCSFHPCINMWYEGFCAFESVREASRFVLFTDGLFYFKKYDGTEQFKKDASFVFSKQVPDFMPRRSQSNISPPQLTKFQHLTAAKPRKFSLMSFRSMRTQNTRSSKLDTMIPLRNTTDVPYSDDDVKKLQKSELFSLGYNECITCLHLTAYNCKTSPCHHVNDGDYCDELVRKISLVSIESSSSSESSFLTLP